MLKRTYDNQYCTVAWALEVIGERWTLLIVRDALLGFSRFGDFRQRLGITASVLASRLSRLIAAGVLERLPYQHHPVRYEYRLTAAGKELSLVILALMRWGDRYLTSHAGPPRAAFHDRCGTAIEPRQHCRQCDIDVPTDEVVVRAVPLNRPDRNGQW